MTSIRAFVGHSFTEDDADLVRRFLKYFEQLSRTMDFSWVHAEQAEPKQLTDKVLSLIADRNLFIGICTRKELASPEACFKPLPFLRDMLLARKRELQWKTSDWIIQEIGLAIGRSLDIILLMENGVRSPGGLQGNIEYIPFERDAPEKAFGKVMEMLSALAPRIVAAPATAPESSTEAPAKKEQQSAGAEDYLTPAPGWDRIAYEFAHFRALILQDIEAADRVSKAYLETKDAEQPDAKERWEALRVYNEMAFGKKSTLAQLESLARARPHSSGTLEHFALGYVRYDEYGKAAETFERAAACTASISNQIYLLGLAALHHARSDALQKATDLLRRINLLEVGDTTAETQRLIIIRDVAEVMKHGQIALAAMERLVELDPGDVSTRFSLAYKHSEQESNDLALLHYTAIPFNQRDATAWNNLGVALDRFSLRAKAVAAYRQSEAMGETLAMSNLAHKLMTAGFTFEANELCETAIKMKDYHKNIGSTFAALKELPDTEQKKHDELVKQGHRKSEVYREVGRALCRIERNEIASDWDGPDCPLSVTLVGQAFQAEGKFERPGNSLLAAGMGLLRPTTQVHVTYRGMLCGRVIEGRVKRDDGAAKNGLLALIGDETKVLMVLSDDGTELKVIEGPHSTEPRQYLLRQRS